MRDVPRDIVFTRYEGHRGVEWLRISYGLFRRAKLAWLMLALSYYLVLVAIKFVPFAGGLAAFVMKPVFAVGFLAAAWNQERGVSPSPKHLFQGFFKVSDIIKATNKRFPAGKIFWLGAHYI